MEELENIIGLDNVAYNEPMSRHTTFAIGGNADIYCEIDSVQKLQKVIEYAKKNNIKITVIGNGSNVLVKDNGIRGLVIKYINKEIEFNDTVVTISAGAQNSKLAREALKHELSGYEFASNIPGTIGGAIVMNAGAYGSEIKDKLIEVTYLDLDKNELVTLQNGECKFAYRNSVFKDMNVVIIEAKFKLEKSSAEDIKATMNEYTKKRIETQPIDRPNAGSTFKRGDGFITAQLIDQAGLKGYSIGGAEVSTKHAGFIINNGTATAQDVLDLVEYVKKTIKEKFDKDIELEVKVIGE